MSAEIQVQDNSQAIHTNATITSSGSTTLHGYGFQQIALVVNIKAAPTGTTPTITFTIQEVDPGDGTTTFGNSQSTSAITTTGVYTAILNSSTSGYIQVSWTVTGTTPSFTQVYSTVVSKVTPTSQAVTTGSSAPTKGTIYGRVQYGASAGVLTPIEATTYTEQTTNFTGSVKSSSASDAAAGTGARTVTITYYDQAGAGPFTETVTLNGTTAVNLVNTNHCYIEKMIVATVGSGNFNVGTITLFTGSGGTGTTVGTIAVGTIVSGSGDNQTLWAHHYVPTGKTTTVYNINCSTLGNQAATVFLRADSVLVANAVNVTISDFVTMATGGAETSRSTANPTSVSGFARITMYVVSQGSNTHFFGSFDYSEQ